MGKQASSPSPSSGSSLNGSNAISHAYIQHPPLRCNIPGAAGVMYDDGNKLLLVPSPSKVHSWPVNQQPPVREPNITTIMEGPVLHVRFSLDGKVLAVQRTHHEVEFVNKETGAMFRQRCKAGTERILGLFWSDCPACDFVLVTSSGLELYTMSTRRNEMKLVEYKRSNVSWYVYTHESRLVLLASGIQCKTLSGYQFSAGGIVRLPKFEVPMTKADANRKPVLAPEDIRIATMYGRLYCLQVDRVAMQLNLYRFYRDAVVPQELLRTWPALLLMYCMGSYLSCCMETLSLQEEGFLPIYSRNIGLSVVDNVLLVHEIDSKVVLLYDILSESKGSISAPLPLLMRGLPHQSLGVDAGTPGVEPNSSENRDSQEEEIYNRGWVFANPDVVLDHHHGRLWKLRLDLEAIAASCSDVPTLLGFLQRRRYEARKAKILCLEALRSMISERQPLPLIGSAMDVLTCFYARLSSVGFDSRRVSQFEPLPSTQTQATPPRDNNSGIDASSAVQPSEKADGDDEPSTSRWTQGSSDQDEEDLDCVSSQVEELGANTPTVDKHKSVQQESSFGGEIKESGSVDMNLSAESSQSTSRDSSLNGDIAVVSPHGVLLDASSPIISPEEFQENIFYVIKADMTLDSAFLVACILEFLRSTSAEQIKVNSGLHVLLIRLLAQEQRFHEIWLLVVGKVVPASRPVAVQLLEIGVQHDPTRRLGLDMLRQVRGHLEYVNELLLEGRLLEGLRYVRQYKVDSVAPAAFLEAAISANDPQKLATVFRFCLDYIPNFSRSPDFPMYSNLVSQQSSVAA